ncbi:MAG: hypothetical protein HFJ35_07655 [Clostridia bacterium]|nr:hypothetical protein [Clostridia bacterium]
MTGSEIRQKINDTKFGQKAIAFSKELFLKLDTPASALEFLTFYCVLLSSKEYQDDEDKLYEHKLFKTYSLVKSKLENNGRICSTEFLKNPPENIVFNLQDNTCSISEE